MFVMRLVAFLFTCQYAYALNNFTVLNASSTQVPPMPTPTPLPTVPLPTSVLATTIISEPTIRPPVASSVTIPVQSSPMSSWIQTSFTTTSTSNIQPTSTWDVPDSNHPSIPIYTTVVIIQNGKTTVRLVPLPTPFNTSTASYAYPSLLSILFLALYYLCCF